MRFEEYCHIYKNPKVGDFLLRERLEREKITVKKIYIDVAGDIVAGLVLNQIIFWNSPDSQGDVHVTVFKDGHLWLAKPRDTWWNECRLTPTQVDRALKHLENKGLIVTSVYHFRGKKAKHARIDWENFLEAMEEAKQSFQGSKTGYKRREPTSGSGDNRGLRGKSTNSEDTSKSTNSENANPLLVEMQIHYQGKCISTNSEDLYIYETFNETFNETNTPLTPQGGECVTQTVLAEVVEEEVEVNSSTFFSSQPLLTETNKTLPKDKTSGRVATKQKKSSTSSNELQVFLDAYQAEKPSNFTNHRELSDKHTKALSKLVSKYKERSLDIFVAALTWCREQESDWWRNKSLSLDNLMSNGKLVEFADKHFDAMDSDPAYCDRVNGKQISFDTKRANGCQIFNENGEELTGASAQVAQALANDPFLQMLVEAR